MLPSATREEEVRHERDGSAECGTTVGRHQVPRAVVNEFVSRRSALEITLRRTGLTKEEGMGPRSPNGGHRLKGRKDKRGGRDA
jgi:hypothetical protein